MLINKAQVIFSGGDIAYDMASFLPLDRRSFSQRIT